MKNSVKTCLALVIAALVVPALHAQKKQPDSMKVSDYRKLEETYQKAYAEEALTSPKIKKLIENIAKLGKPVALKDRVEFMVRGRRGDVVKLQGTLYSVNARRARIGDREYPGAIFDPVDWLILQAAEKPGLLKAEIKKMEEEKKAEIKRFVEIKVKSKLKSDGYSSDFLKKVVTIGSEVPHYVLRTDAGDGTFLVGVFQYGVAGKHMEPFVKFVVDYNGNLPIAFVLVVDSPDKKGKPLVPCRFGTVDATKKITEAPFKGRSYFLSKAQLQKHLGDKWEKTVMENLRVVILKRKGMWDGIWELAPKGVKPIRGNSRLDCPDCWGQKAVTLASAVDIRDEVEAVLKEAHASDEIKKRGEALIREYAAEPAEDAKREACSTCEAKGTVGYVRATGGIVSFKLNEKTIWSYKKKLPDFKLLYESVIPKDAVRKLRENIAGKFAKERLKARREEGIDKAKELVSEFLEIYNKSKFVALSERYQWMTPMELEAAKKASGVAPGEAPVLFGGNESAGYAPKQLFDKKVRRFGPWLQLRRFKKIGSFEEGYDINQVFYRVVEIGGSDIDATPEVEGEKPPVVPGGRTTPRGTVPPPRGTVPDEFEDPMMFEGEGTVPPPGNGGGEVPVPVPVNEVPEDIGDREYVFQYAIFAGTSRNKRIAVATNLVLTLKPRLKVMEPAKPGEKPKELMGFPLTEAETKFKLQHKYRIPAGWNGWLLGSEKMTFAQMIADYSYRDLKVELTVK